MTNAAYTEFRKMQRWVRIALVPIAILMGFAIVNLAGDAIGALNHLTTADTVVLCVYFLPTLIVPWRAPNAGRVFLINLLTGWTVIGWFVALGLAGSARTR